MKQKPFSCAAVALQIEARTGWRFHRGTIRGWALELLIPGDDYLTSPGTFKIYPTGVEKLIVNKLNKPE